MKGILSYDRAYDNYEGLGDVVRQVVRQGKERAKKLFHIPE